MKVDEYFIISISLKPRFKFDETGNVLYCH